MLFFKYFLFSFLLNGLFSQLISFDLDGSFDNLSLGYLVDLNEEVPFLELTELNFVKIILNKNIFDDIENDSNKSLIEEVNYFKDIYFYFEYWTQFNQSSNDLWLKIDICGNRYNEKIIDKTRIKILNKLNRFDLIYLFKNNYQECIKNFSVSTFLVKDNLTEEFDYHIDKFLIFKLGVYYATVNSQFNQLIEGNLKNDYQQMNEIWYNLEKAYNNSQNQANLKPIKYECVVNDCKSFLIYPELDKKWYFFPTSFYKEKQLYLIENNKNNLQLTINGNFEEIKFYSVIINYFITENVLLNIKTSLNNKSILSLYPSYKKQKDSSNFVNDWCESKIDILNIIPFQDNLSFINFKLVFELIQSKNFDNLDFVAFKSFEIIKNSNQELIINDYLKSWSSLDILDDWYLYPNNSLINTSFDNDGLSIIFKPSELEKNISSILLSQWFILNDQNFKFEVKIKNLNCHFILEIIDQNFNTVEFDNLNLVSNYYYEKKINHHYFKDQSQIEEIIFDPKFEKKKVVKLKISLNLKKNDSTTLDSSLIIKNLRLGDPCENKNICKNRGTCLILSSKNYECNCDEKYHGKNCEFVNKCDEIAIKLCKNQNNSKCIPIGNFFKCDCGEFYFWYDEKKECRPKSFCLKNQCESQNSLCVHDLQKGSSCECNLNYEYNDLNFCTEINYCKIDSCLANEICHSKYKKNSLKNFFCECNFQKGFIEIDSKCVYLPELNPFIKQSLNCSQSYKKNSDNDLYECDCIDGFSEKKGNQCISNEDFCFSICTNKQLCMNFKEKEPFCECKLGFENYDCETDFCQLKNNQDFIKSICGNESCKTKLRNDNFFFECDCDQSIYFTSQLNGLCQMKDMCELDSIEYQVCQSRNSICVPSVKNNKLTYECVCAKGFEFNEQTNKCENNCFGYENFFVQTVNRVCLVDDYFLKPKLVCKPGFNEEDRMCYFNDKTKKYKLEIITNIILSKDIFDSLKNLNNEDLLLIDCEKYLDKEKCTKTKKKTLNQLNGLSINFFINNVLKHKLSKLLKISFQSILGENIDSLSILDLSYVKFNSLFKLDILIQANENSIDLEEEIFLSNCNNSCKIDPYLVFETQNFKLKKIRLENFSYLLECFQGSKPIIHNNNKFSCVCKEGYKEIGRVPLTKDQKFFKAICEEIDECSLKLHNCDLNSTNCINLPGSYECSCSKSSYIKKTNYSCFNPCELTNCKIGKCIIESNNQFGCVCDEKCQNAFAKTASFYLAIFIFILIVIFILLLFFYLFKNRK